MIDLDLDLKDVKKVLNFLSFDDRLENYTVACEHVVANSTPLKMRSRWSSNLRCGVAAKFIIYDFFSIVYGVNGVSIRLPLGFFIIIYFCIKLPPKVNLNLHK